MSKASTQSCTGWDWACAPWSQARPVVSVVQSVTCGSVVRPSLNRAGWAGNAANVPGARQRD
eukprot:1205728-Lingulodinium_polyedra.AAC.1